MQPERPTPESGEADVNEPLSPDEQLIFDGLEAILGKPIPESQLIDDQKRPLPDEINWGVPGAETEQ